MIDFLSNIFSEKSPAIPILSTENSNSEYTRSYNLIEKDSQWQTKNTVTSSALKSNEYRSNFDSTTMDPGYQDDLESGNNFRP